MLEDFGWSGDEYMIGDCMDDWAMDRLDILSDQTEEREREREELALEFSDEEKPERDLCDIVREHEESEDWADDTDDYLDCEWEE